MVSVAQYQSDISGFPIRSGTGSISCNDFTLGRHENIEFIKRVACSNKCIRLDFRTDSMSIIQGVQIKTLTVHYDIPDAGQKNVKPGFLVEVLRADDALLKKFGQTVFTVAYPGTIKAFHWHKKQDDLWFFANGRARVVLYDRRQTSPTKGQTQVIYAGQNDYKLIFIPQGVVHGYQIIGQEPSFLFYHVTEMYDTKDPDEERIPYDDPEIGFDWSLLPET